MESKVPFIADYDPYAITRPLKRHRPISTRPWTLSLFLAATGICFGLLLGVSLIEKDPLPTTKRDVDHLYQRHALLDRQDSAATTEEAAVTTVYVYATTTEGDPGAASTTVPVASTAFASDMLSVGSQCTSYGTSMVTVCSPTSGYVCPTIPPAAAATTGTCVTSYVYETITVSALLSLTSQCTETVYATAEICVPQSGYICDEGTTQQPAAASAGTCDFTTTSTETMSYPAYLLSLTSQCTTFAIGTVSVCTALGNAVCPEPATTTVYPAAVTTGPCSTSTTYITTISTALLSIVSQTPSQTVEYSSDAVISITSQPTVTTESPASESSSTYVEQSVSGDISITSQSVTLSESSFASSTYLPSVATTSTISIMNSFSNPVPTISPTATFTTMFQVYTLTFEDLTETLSLYTDESTTVTATDGTYLVAQSTGSLETSLYAASSSVSLLNQGGSYTRTATPSAFSITTTPHLSSTTSATASTTSAALNIGLRKDLVLVKLPSFHPYYYFVVVYLPKLLAVTMAILWGVIFAGLKLMEPFYQLSAPNGALARDTMVGNYLASELTVASLSATFHGRWVLLLGGAVTIIWSAIVALASESMSVLSTGRCQNKDHSLYRCDPAWAVSPTVIMVLLALTGLAFVLITILMLILSQRRRSGCYHDPSSIAAMTELLGNPHVTKDFCNIKPSSSDREVKLLLGDNRYKIGLYDPLSGKEAHEFRHDHSRWGLIKLSEAPISQRIARRQSAGYSAVLNPNIVIAEEQKANRRRRILQLVYDITMLLVALCIFALVLGYYLDSKHDPLNDFFNSATFGSQFVLTCLALILAIGWRRVSQDMTLMAPYRGMARAFQAGSGVMAEKSILVRPARSPWAALYRGLQSRYYMVTVVAICAALADILLIAVSGVPYTSGMTKLSLVTSSYTSLAILGIMILTSIAVLIYNRTSAGGTRKLPRNPDTLLGVWLYLCHSKLVPSPEICAIDKHLSPLDDDELKMKYQLYQCGFAQKEGEDGIRWWTVDSVAGLNSERIPAMQQPHSSYQSHTSRGDNETQSTGPQPHEASATPIDNPYGNFQSQPAPSQRAVAPTIPSTAPSTVLPTALATPQDTTFNISLPYSQTPHQSQRYRYRHRHHHIPNSDPDPYQTAPNPFETQPRSHIPHTQIAPPTSAFEAIRPQRHQVLPQRQQPMQSRFEERDGDVDADMASTPQEALMQHEYEQEFYRGHTSGSGNGYGMAGRTGSAGSSIYSQATMQGNGYGYGYEYGNGAGGGNGRWTNDGRSRFKHG